MRDNEEKIEEGPNSGKTMLNECLNRKRNWKPFSNDFEIEFDTE